MNDLLFILWIFLPAGVANVAPILIAHMPFFRNFNFPLDFYKTYREKRLLGDGKTIRGLVFGVLCAIGVSYLQAFIYRGNPSLQTFFPDGMFLLNPLLWGLLSGFGALLGDSVKSFFKRQIAVPRGESWIPFDQIDYVLGFIVCTYFYYSLTIPHYVLLLTVWFLLHLLFTHIGYWLGFKKSPL